MCTGEDSLAAGLGWRDPGSIHKATLTGLAQATTYFYFVGSNVTTSTSAISSFTTPPPPGVDIDFIIFGDLGQADTDGSVGWTEWKATPGGIESDSDQPLAVNTTLSIYQDLTDGTIDNKTGIVLIIGDVSYARGREPLWDQFHYMLQPVSEMTPIMTLLGNHEMNVSHMHSLHRQKLRLVSADDVPLVFRGSSCSGIILSGLVSSTHMYAVHWHLQRIHMRVSATMLADLGLLSLPRPCSSRYGFRW